ncbi:hypothetical protein JB92DRAFT_3097835 [Gautieria morchelliformis]|nr:hypothetical protein JB92DRAFT_3097835 [Gautieria morchelliformis]
MAIAGTVSCALLSSLLLAVGLPTLLNGRRKSPDASATFALFVICLLCSDLVQSISATALVIGDLGHCVITGHIFSVLALERQWSRKVVVSIVVTGWTFVTSQSEYAPIIVLNQAVLKRLLLPGPNESAQWIFLFRCRHMVCIRHLKEANH